MNILVVDDEQLVRRALKRAFLRSGVEIREAENGKVGAELWRQSAPDVAFVDLLMPVCSGAEMLEQVNTTATFVVLMSAYSGINLDTGGGALQGKSHFFVKKPFEDIFQIVQLALSAFPKKKY